MDGIGLFSNIRSVVFGSSPVVTAVAIARASVPKDKAAIMRVS